MDGSPSKSRADLEAGANLADEVVEASAVLIDAEAVSADEVRSYDSLLRAARLAGVPVILENARDAHKVAAALGLGISGAVVYAAPDASGQRFDVRVFGDFKGEESMEQTSTRLLPTSTPVERVEKSEMVQTAVPEAGELLAEIQGLVANHERITRYQITAAPMPEGTYRAYNVTYPSYQWECGGSQKSTIDRNFTVTLFASNLPAEGKFVVFTGNGTQYSPGPLAWNSDLNRGFFQEKLQHYIKPMDPGLSPFAHMPLTANGSSTFTTSNGFSVSAGIDGANGPFTSVTFEESQQASQTMNDFDVIDYSAGTVFQWDYNLASVGGHPYDEWFDLIGCDGLCSPPNLAKSTLTAQYEGMYFADIENQSMIRVFTQDGQRVRHTWLGLYPDTTSCSKFLTDIKVVDLGSVNVAKLGTIPFTETFDQGIASNVWTAVNEGITDSSPSWGPIAGTAAELGGAYDYPQTGDGAIDMRGTYLWAPHTAFGQGALTASVYAGDPDGFGLMYAVNETGSSYYRVMFDKTLSVARLVRVDNGVFTELAVNNSFIPPQNNWMTLRIEREGTTHRVLLNDQVVLAVQGEATYPWGSVGLFSWGMSNVRFDNVKITWL
jgi:hypothetical protein